MTLSSRLTAARPVRTVDSLRLKSSMTVSMRGRVSLITSFSLISLTPVNCFQEAANDSALFLEPDEVKKLTCPVRPWYQRQVHPKLLAGYCRLCAYQKQRSADN